MKQLLSSSSGQTRLPERGQVTVACCTLTLRCGRDRVMQTHLRAELVVQALNRVLDQRRPSEVIHHCDQGSQYTSIAFGKRCEEAGVRPSMGSVGDAYDNALCESFFATLECELLDRRRFRTQVEARLAVFEFIEGWYNSHRLHSGLGCLSPMEFEHRGGRVAGVDSRDGVQGTERQGVLWDLVSL